MSGRRRSYDPSMASVMNIHPKETSSSPFGISMPKSPLSPSRSAQSPIGSPPKDFGIPLSTSKRTLTGSSLGSRRSSNGAGLPATRTLAGSSVNDSSGNGGSVADKIKGWFNKSRRSSKPEISGPLASAPISPEQSFGGTSANPGLIKAGQDVQGRTRIGGPTIMEGNGDMTNSGRRVGFA
ncbi:hypothetical protein HDV00_009437 [Rhizophlyctis rosea]|nr:hypothetical protein HDV00_009437 [Rhizophlyctis rosea]